MSNADWTPSTVDPRIEIRKCGGQYQARWELLVPATRVRCEVCRKDLVMLMSDNAVRMRKHICDSQAGLTYPRGYKYVRRKGNVRNFLSLDQAVAVALDKAGFTPRMRQVESPELGAST